MQSDLLRSGLVIISNYAFGSDLLFARSESWKYCTGQKTALTRSANYSTESERIWMKSGAL